MTASSDGRVGPGQKIKAIPNGIWNAMVAAGQAHLDRELAAPTTISHQFRRPDLVKVKNSTGALRQRGEVVSLGELLIDDIDPDHFWLDGKPPKRGKHFAVLKYNVEIDKIVEAQVLGLTIARVNVSSNSHRYARLPDDPATFVLQSCHIGPIQLLYSPEITTASIENCLVNIGHSPHGIFKTPSGGIAARSGSTCGNADCDIYWIDDDGVLTTLVDDNDNVQTAKIFNYVSGAIGGSTFITAKDVHGIQVVDSEDCG